MTLEEAIAILTGQREYSQSEFNTAVRLGIEALKRIGVAREHAGYMGSSLLPGETVPKS
jgi:hypothetical protein